jgi:DNA polymerase IV
MQPLDPLEEGSVEANDTEASDASDTESIGKKESHLSKEDKMVEAWQQKFACMQKHDSNSKVDNPNSKTIEVLQQMLDYYTRTSDQWRTLAYRKAIAALRRQPRKVVTRAQARAIPGIGPRLADKVEEIVFTNRLRRLENANNTPEDRILQEFLGVYGAGISQASRWIAQGYRSLDDLKTKASLTKSQRIGVEHYHDFAQRIPRREVEAHGEIVRKAVQKADPGMQVIIGGSYRRGVSDTGDIDLLITKGDATIEQITALMMDNVIPQLFQNGFLQVSLASTSRGDGSKWHGASVLPGSKIWRRIDLLFVPGSEIGAALIYFTGNDIFNRSMRLLASKKGMRLNQRGLYADVLRGEQRKKLNEGQLLEGRDERRIFEILGVPWRPPEHRIC